MILYDSKNNFLGMSQKELSLLGYEDIDDFRSFFDDFAELFIESPGYISRFKNFSWIEYVLHSGTQNKNVLLRHKNGKEIDTELSVSEIYLIKDIDNATNMYCVEIKILTDINRHNLAQSNSNKEKITQNKLDDLPKERKIEDKDDTKELITQPTNQDNFDKLLVEDYEDFLAKNSTKKSIEQNTAAGNIQTHNEEQQYKSTDYKDENDLSLKDELTAKITKTNKETLIGDDTGNINFLKLANDSSINLNELANYLEEFIIMSKKYLMKIIMTKENGHYIKNEAIILKGISQALNMKDTTKILNDIITQKDYTEANRKLKLFDQHIEKIQKLIS